MIKYLFSLCLLVSIILPAQSKTVHVINIDGAINPAATDYIQCGIEEAVKSNSECLIIKLNTPGGLLKSTRLIVSQFLESEIPIIIYVSPPGAQAASAGVFITMAAHIAVMSPGTNIGAAHPVSLQGQQDTIMMAKATNDAAAFIRSIGEKRNRNVEWGEDAVRKSLSITAAEAKEINVIDLIAEDISALLDSVDQRSIEIHGENIILNTKDANIIELEQSFQQKILSVLSDPNIAYVLLMLGFYGLLFELYNPGAILPGVVGVICLILAFYSLHTLPINYAGLALIIFAIVLFLLEMKVVSHGILTVGGTVSLVMGSIMLIDIESALEFVEISWEVIAFVVILTLLFFVFALSLGIKAQKRKPTTGSAGLKNEIGVTISDLSPHGQVKVHGEIWQAESIEGNIEVGVKVLVADIKDLKLMVKKID